ncbi:DUF1294 domain-containing protein [Psychromonas aquimarina]|uniref:DUF1294 domain-containing protein n=1 Tax=Psychromonas aquimarina TaxID=444919 RepID=UPI0004076DB5|nr:DUF1294 domain-containing protein [Psychromonas aquimarina]
MYPKFILLITSSAFIYSALTAVIPSSLVYYYGLINTLTFLCYAVDKYAACHNRWRIKESRLHLLSLIGGWFGALVAQIIVNHKLCKTSFQAVYWLTAVLHNIALVYFLSEQGNEYIVLLLNYINIP